LLTAFVQVRRVEPTQESVFKGGPFPVDGGVPRGIAVTALVDRGLAKHPLERQPEALCRRAGFRIKRVALPFVPSITELERPLHHEVHGLRCRRGTLQAGRIVDAADLDRSARGGDPQIARYTDRFARSVVNDCVKQRIASAAMVVHPAKIVLQGFERTIGQIGPNPTFRVQRIRVVEVGRVAVGIKRLHTAEAPNHRGARWAARRLSVLKGEADRLAQAIQVVRHAHNLLTRVCLWLMIAKSSRRR
jgi:hypothetical protein